MDSFKLHQLQYLVAVTKLGSIRAAARSMNVTQAAVTQGVKELEETCGVPLLVRHSSGVGLTEAGRQLQQHAQVVIEQLAKAQADMARYHDGDAVTTLSVGVTPWVAHFLLPHVITTFRRMEPQVQFVLFEGLTAVALPKLREGALDILIGRIPDRGLTADLNITPVFAYEAVVAARHGHPREKARSLKDLRDCEWLLNFAPEERVPMLKLLFEQHGVEVPSSRIHLAYSTSLVMELAAHSDVVTLCPWPLMESDAGRTKLCPIPLREHFGVRTIGILRRRHDALTWAAKRFIDHFLLEAERCKRTTDPSLKRVLRRIEVLV